MMANILIGCEYSGTVRDAFIKLGHDAISCDLLPTEKPGPHYQGDVYDMLDKQWDLIIMHPPCTALAVSGNAWYGEGMAKHRERLEAVMWTRELWLACLAASKHVCFENPVGVLQRMGGFKKPSYVQPWMFGHKEQKKTGLYLHNLPPLITTDNVYYDMMQLSVKERQRMFHLPPSKDRWKIRSTTYKGIADAMAKQWGEML